VLVFLMKSFILSEDHNASILRTELPIAPSLFFRLVTGPSAHGPARRAGAQRLGALAHHIRRGRVSGT
jgi:hypothetical protein